jgi:hypothetical protein
MAKNYYDMVTWIKFLADNATSLVDFIYIRKIIDQFENVLLNDDNVEVASFKSAVYSINDDTNDNYIVMLKELSDVLQVECVAC